MELLQPQAMDRLLLAMWMGPEWTGTIGSSAYNIYPGDGGANSTPLYYTDVYYSASEDGGANLGSCWYNSG